MENITQWYGWAVAHPGVQITAALVLLAIAAWLANWVVKNLLVRGLYRLLGQVHFPGFARADGDEHYGMIRRLSNVVPALVISNGIMLIALPSGVITVVRNVCHAFIILTVALSIGGLLNLVNKAYQRRPDAANRPIKGYIQIGKIFVYAFATILMIAALLDRSPLILLSGLGALAAVLMLVFQDTLLSLVASVQISSSGIVRPGDWIEMPQVNADGEVVDIALHTISVQNWDKTVTTIPTKKFLSDSFKNWRGMTESGGRRIKRCLWLDQTSVRFLTTDEQRRLRRFMLLDDYLAQKNDEIARWNGTLAEYGKEAVNTRRVTNIGTFRAYVEQYLRHHPFIHQDMTLIVRQLAPTAEGMPLELYCFTNDIRWVRYEGIQSDIFDHLLAILPEFDLRVFQNPGGADFRVLAASRAETLA